MDPPLGSPEIVAVAHRAMVETPSKRTYTVEKQFEGG